MARVQIDVRKSESVFIDFPIESESGAVTVIPGTMTASFKVVDSTGIEVEAGTLAKSGDNTQFELRITDTMINAWAVGSMPLDVLVDDSDNGYANFIFEGTIVLSD